MGSLDTRTKFWSKMTNNRGPVSLQLPNRWILIINLVTNSSVRWHFNVILNKNTFITLESISVISWLCILDGSSKNKSILLCNWAMRRVRSVNTLIIIKEPNMSRGSETASVKTKQGFLQLLRVVIFKKTQVTTTYPVCSKTEQPVTVRQQDCFNEGTESKG